MGMRASDHMPVDLTLHVEVRAIARAASDLVETVGPYRPRANHFEFLIGVHAASPRIVLAASNTARMILS